MEAGGGNPWDGRGCVLHSMGTLNMLRPIPSMLGLSPACWGYGTIVLAGGPNYLWCVVWGFGGVLRQVHG